MSDAITPTLKYPVLPPPPDQVLQPKLIFPGDIYAGQNLVYVGDDKIVLMGKRHQGVSIDQEYGVAIGGHLSVFESPEKISWAGGYWRFNPMLLTCLGSSAATPVPTFVKAVPDALQSQQDIEDAMDMLSQLDSELTGG